MNNYLRRACRSEQQLLNELGKLLGASELSARKLGDLLRELSFFYADSPAASATIVQLPHALLRGLVALLPRLQERKDEHQRLARLALCLLARLADQFEQQAARDLASRHAASFDLSDVALRTLLTTIAPATAGAPAPVTPRQLANLRVYAQLCRIFRQPDELFACASILPPVSDAKSDGKRRSGVSPALLAAAGGACHALRFHLPPSQQALALDHLVQTAFALPAAAASRHAAGTLLALFAAEEMDQDSQPISVAVTKALERYLLAARPSTLQRGDSLTSVYLLRLVGELQRHLTQQRTSTSVLSGVFVSNALTALLQDYVAEVLQTAIASAGGGCAVPVVLAALEEAVRGASSVSSTLELPGGGGSRSVFELAAAVMLTLLPDAGSLHDAGAVSVLHRVCRFSQLLAERLDTVALEHSEPSPAFLTRLTPLVMELSTHTNVFVARQAFCALLWLLPRDASHDWKKLMQQLEVLPLSRIQPEARGVLAETLFRRAATLPKALGACVDVPLLAVCLRVTLVWFRLQPCEWHAASLTVVWGVALREQSTAMGAAVFAAVNEVLDAHCAPTAVGAHADLLAKHSALQFIVDCGARCAVTTETWSRSLTLRLVKQTLLGSATSRRLSLQALVQLQYEAQLQGHVGLSQELATCLQRLQPTEGTEVSSMDSSDVSKLQTAVQDVEDSPVGQLETRDAFPFA